MKKQPDTRGTLEVVDNVVPFAKPAPAPPGGPDWLRTLPPDSRFLAKKKNASGYALEWFGIGQTLPKAMLLAHEGQMGGMGFTWVITEKFCQTYDFHSMLPQPVLQEEQDEDNSPTSAGSGNNEHEP
jgi:hypothetical protein